MESRLFGIGLVAAGLAFLLERTGLLALNFSVWSVGWVLFGGYVLSRGIRGGRPRWVELSFGGWMLAVGLLDVLRGMGLSATGGEVLRPLFWPVLLIALGLSFLSGNFRASIIWTGHGGKVGSRRWGAIGDHRIGGPGFVLQEDVVVEHGIGDTKIDLSAATILPGTYEIRVQQGLGNVDIRLPDDVSVIATGHVGMGELDVLGQLRNGIKLSATSEALIPEADVVLTVTADLGLGNCRITRSAPPGGLRVLKP
jgi:hypothetical protein